MSDYVVLRSRHNEVIEEMVEVEEIIIEPERERDKV
jgi:hypothetical protein